MTIPAEVRAAAGPPRGGAIVLRLADGDLRLRSVARAVERAQAIGRVSLADELGARFELIR